MNIIQLPKQVLSVKMLLACLFLLAGVEQVRAQANAYSFSATTGTYTSITGGTQLNSSIPDSWTSAALSLSPGFTFSGVTYTTAYITSNGLLTLGGSAPSTTSYNAISSTTGSGIALCVFNADLQGSSVTGATPEMRFETVGVEHVFQWTDAMRYAYGDRISLQIRLNTSTGQIQFVYGGNIVVGSSTSRQPIVGIRTSTTDYSNLTVGTGTETWSSPLPGTSTTSAMRFTSTAPAKAPVAGTVYTWTPPAPCSGTPSAGTITGPSAVCSGSNFTLTATGYTTGASGLTYQWQKYNQATNTWDPAPGTNTNVTYTTSITTAADFRFTLTCANGGGSNNTTPVTITLNPYYNCYCTPASTCTNEGIENVSFSTINNSSTFCVSTSGYSDYSNLGSAATVTQAQQVPVSVTAHINSNPASAGVWIDYNHNGAFDGSEYTSLGSATVTIPTGGTTYTFTGNVTIDPNALTGITRMRVRTANQSGITNTSSCTSSGVYGEYEDYLITINPGVQCSGTPVAGTVSGPSSVCAGASFTLTASGYTTGVLGLTYQWQSFDANTNTWIPAAGTNNAPTYTSSITTATDYRFVITCNNGGGSDVTSTVSLTINQPTQCYCTPSGASASYGINNFSTTGGTTNISNLASGYSTGGYGNYTGQVLTAPISSVVNFSASYIGTGTYGFAIFIDYNQNGSFADAGEVVFNTTSYATTASGSFTVPATALQGNTRMRIVANYSSSNPSAQYCSTGINGEFEDYTINIAPPPSCIAPVVAAPTGITTNSADINWTASSSAPSGGYEYYYSTTNTAPTATTTPMGSVPAGTTTASLTGLNSSTTYYYWVRANCGNNDYSAWAGGSFMTLLLNDLPAGAITLTVNASCTAAPYSNVGGSVTANEPRISCKGSQTAGAIVWFKFVAPPSGFVKVSTDVTGNTLTDTRIGVFTTSNPSNPADLASYSIIACDDDNGITLGAASMVYVPGLTPGNTYYVGVDHYNGSSTGTFCVEVKDVTSSMLAAAGSCAAGQSLSSYLVAYTGWLSLTDNSGNLIANVKPISTTNATTNSFGSSVTVNTATIRTDGNNTPYLDRNFYMSGSGITSADVQFFFKDAELQALGTTVSNINVTRQTGSTCQANYNGALGGGSLLTQMNNGSMNGINWVTVNTPGFSNFYLNAGASPLVISLGEITAVNIGAKNRVNWNTLTEERGDRFELERSTDGKSFNKIAELSTNGAASSYSYTDETAATGINYYRLKLTDASGSFIYSKIVNATVKAGGAFSVEAYPNPVNDRLTIRVNGSIGTNARVDIVDISGKTVKSQVVTDNTTSVATSELPSGIYLVRYTDSNHNEVLKINKN